MNKKLRGLMKSKPKVKSLHAVNDLGPKTKGKNKRKKTK